MRLIDLDEFLRENCVSRETAELFPGEGQSSCDGCDHRTLEVSCERMLEFPTIDPVKHGSWVLENGCVRCSECGEPNMEWNYCPNCGARMDGEEKDV